MTDLHRDCNRDTVAVPVAVVTVVAAVFVGLDIAGSAVEEDTAAAVDYHRDILAACQEVEDHCLVKKVVYQR